MIVYALWSPNKKEWHGTGGRPVSKTAMPKIWSQKHHAVACMKRGKSHFWSQYSNYTWVVVRFELNVLDKMPGMPLETPNE
jgi:hypothetical protein